MRDATARDGCAGRHGTGRVCGTARHGTACAVRHGTGRNGMSWSTSDQHGAARVGVCGAARHATGVRYGTARDGVCGSAQHGTEWDVTADYGSVSYTHLTLPTIYSV